MPSHNDHAQATGNQLVEQEPKHVVARARAFSQGFYMILRNYCPKFRPIN